MTDEVKVNKDNSDPSTPNRVLDHAVLLSVVDGDADLLRDLCALLLRSYPSAMSEMRGAIARNDGNALAQAAHRLKGSAGHFITGSARSLLTDLGMIGQGGDLTKGPERLADLEAEMERLKPELSRLAEEEPETSD